MNKFTMTKVPFNVWDDFWDDGCIPRGKVQQTHGYVEEYDVLVEREKEEIVELVLGFVRTLDMPGVEVSRIGDQLVFKHLTHARLGKLMEELEGSGLKWEGMPIDFYSES